MTLWTLLNSPIMVVIASFLLAGVTGAVLSQRLQRRSKLIELRLMQFRETEQAYHHYIRLLKGDVSRLSTEEWDAVHAQLCSLGRSNRPLFRTEMARTGWSNVAQHMATLRDLKIKGNAVNMHERLDEIRSMVDQVREATIREIAG